MNSAGTDVAVTVLATLGAVFWSIQLIPQIFINWRRKSSDGLQPSMMILWAVAGLPLGVHNILSNQNIALQVQAQILTSLSLITWGQVMYYDHHWSARITSLTLAGLMVLFGAVEAALVLGFKYGTKDEGVKHRTVVAMAILAAVLLSMGVLRHYYDIAKHRTVRGISFFFVGLDAAGDLTSLLAVTIRSPPDTLAAVIYGSELVLWIGIMVAGVVFNLREYIGQRLQQRRERIAEIRATQEAPSQSTPHEEQQPHSLSRQSSAFSTIVPSVPDSTPRSLLMRLRRRPLQV